MADPVIKDNPNVIISDLGAVTAYADAVAGGFEGTREEWEKYLAGIGDNAGRAERAAEAAQESMEAAAQSEESAAESKTAAAASAENSAASEANAEKAANRAEAGALKNGYAEMRIEDGELVLYRTSNLVEKLDFAIKDHTQLEALIYG